MSVPDGFVPATPGSRDCPARSTTILAVALVAACVVQFLVRSLASPGIDFQQFWSIAKAVHEPAVCRHPYRPEGREAIRARLEARMADGKMGRRERAATTANLALGSQAGQHVILPTGTPFFYAVFHSLGTVTGWNFEIALPLYRIAMACAAVAAALLAIDGGRGLSGTAIAAMVVLCSVLPEAAQTDARVANVSILQGLGVAVASRMMRSANLPSMLVAGFAFAVVTAFKPTTAGSLAAVLLLLLATCQLRSCAALAAGALAGIGVCVGLGAAWYGSLGGWVEWLDNMRELAEPMRMFSATLRDGNISLMQWLQETIGTRPRIPAAFAIGIVWIVAIGRRASRPTSGIVHEQAILLAACSGIVSTLFLADLAWLHYYAIVLPLAIVLLGGQHGGVSDGPHMPAVVVGFGAFAALFGLELGTLLGVGPYVAVGIFHAGWLTLLVVSLIKVSAGQCPTTAHERR